MNSYTTMVFLQTFILQEKIKIWIYRLIEQVYESWDEQEKEDQIFEEAKKLADTKVLDEKQKLLDI